MGTFKLKGAELASLYSIVQQMETNNSVKPLRVKLRIQTLMLISAVGVLVMDWVDGGSLSGILKLSQFDGGIIPVIAGFMLAVLLILILSSFFVVKEHADSDELSVKTYLSRFKVLRIGALLSDLMLQFLFISALLYFGKGIWVPALLVLFTGHFVVQNYLFNFSQRQILILTAVCYLGGAGMLYWGVQSLIPALALFIVINLFSIFVTSWEAR